MRTGLQQALPLLLAPPQLPLVKHLRFCRRRRCCGSCCGVNDRC